MIFKPELCEKVLDGSKVMTRRRLTHRGGRPLGYKVGGVYAVQPGRGKPHVGHIEVTGGWHEALYMLTEGDAKAEGFATTVGFFEYWYRLHGTLDLAEVVAVFRFKLAPSCAECVALVVPA